MKIGNASPTTAQNTPIKPIFISLRIVCTSSELEIDKRAVGACRDPHQAKEKQHQQQHHARRGRRFSFVQGLFQPGAQRLQRSAQQEGRRQNQQQLGIRKGRQRIPAGPALPCQDAAPRGQTLPQTRRAEDDQRGPEHRHRIKMPEKFRHLVEQLSQTQPFKTENYAVQQAEHHILPRRAVPQAGERKDDEQVQAGAAQPTAASAQRDIEIVPEPAGQRDMPPPPVFADRAGEIRVVEVFRQGDTEEFSDADGHIAVAGEVKIQLHHIRRVAQHKNRCRQRGGGHRCDLCVDQRQLVGDDGLFGKAQHQPLDAVAEAVRRNTARLPAGVKLRGLLPIADNGAGRPVAEEREKHREPEGAFFLGAARPAATSAQ